MWKSSVLLPSTVQKQKKYLFIVPFYPKICIIWAAMEVMIPGIFNKTHFGGTRALSTHLLHFLCLIDHCCRKKKMGHLGPALLLYNPFNFIIFSSFPSSQTLKTNLMHYSTDWDSSYPLLMLMNQIQFNLRIMWILTHDQSIPVYLGILLKMRIWEII